MKRAYNITNAVRPWEERQALREAPRPACKCGCGTLTEWSYRGWLTYARGHRWAQLDGVTIAAMYCSGRTAASLAEEFGSSPSRVRELLRSQGVELRSHSEAITGKFAGEKNPSWKGGVTPERQRLYKSTAWKRLVRAVYERDGFACQRCGDRRNAPGNRFHAHHIRPWSLDPTLRTEQSNLVTLCKSCHLWVHSTENCRGEFLDLAEVAA